MGDDLVGIQSHLGLGPSAPWSGALGNILNGIHQVNIQVVHRSVPCIHKGLFYEERQRGVDVGEEELQEERLPFLRWKSDTVIFNPNAATMVARLD